ncbi:MAG TPA: hypothetical protein VGQ71_05965 [Terriglobales bacterium]|nr:hypothetical protein [Terriglobales bacterium]
MNDFIAHGTITYYYSPTQSKTGQVTIRGHGDGKFRMDSILQDGTTTAWAVNDGNGQVKDADGQIRNVGFPSAVNAGWLTLPYMRLATVLNDNLTQLSYIALLSINGASFHQIRASSPFGKVEDPGGLLADLRTADYYLSSVDLKVIAIADKLYPAASYWSEQPWSGNHQRRSANDLLLRFSAGEWDPDSICSYKRSRTTAVMDYPVDRHQFQYRRN